MYSCQKHGPLHRNYFLIFFSAARYSEQKDNLETTGGHDSVVTIGNEAKSIRLPRISSRKNLNTGTKKNDRKKIFLEGTYSIGCIWYWN